MDLSQLPAVGPALFCGACGGGVVAGSRFCTRCGAAVEAAAGAAPAPQAVAPPPVVSPPVAPVADGPPNVLTAISFPFAQPDWQRKLCGSFALRIAEAQQ